MISLEKSKFTVDGVDVYGDHVDPAQFWYVPGTIQLAQRDDRKVLSYFWYTDSASDQNGTGFLNFEVNTAVSADTMDRIRSEAAARSSLGRDRVRLAGVTYQAGNVNFSVLGPMAGAAKDRVAGDDAVVYAGREQVVWSAGSSSLVGDNAAVCSVRFTKEGGMAKAMKEAILTQSNSIAALYRLEYLAMQPSVTFRVTGTLDKTIRDFQASLGASIPLESFILDLGVQAQWQRVISSSDLKIELVNFSGEESQGVKWAQQIVLDYVLKNFFQVEIAPGTGRWSPLSEAPKVDEAVSRAKDTELAAGEQADAKGKEGQEKTDAVQEVVRAATSFIPKVNVRASFYAGSQTNTIDFLYSESKARRCLALPQSLVLSGLKDPKNYVVQVNRSQDPFGLPYPVTVSVPTPDDRARLGLRTVNVRAVYPADAPWDQQITKNLTVDGATVTGQNPLPLQYDARGSAQVDYRVDYVFAPSDEWHTDSYQHTDTGKSDNGLIVAMPEAVVEFLALDIRLGTDFVWDDADQAVVALTSTRWEGEKRVVFSPGREAPQTYRIRSAARFRKDPIQARVEIRKSGKVVHAYGPEPVQDDQVTVRDRFAGHVPVFFKPVFSEGSVDVSLTYTDGDLAWESQFIVPAGAETVRQVVPTLREFRPPSTLVVDYSVTPEKGAPYTGTVKGGQTVRLTQTAP